MVAPPVIGTQQGIMDPSDPRILRWREARATSAPTLNVAADSDRLLPILGELEGDLLAGYAEILERHAPDELVVGVAATLEEVRAARAELESAAGPAGAEPAALGAILLGALLVAIGAAARGWYMRGAVDKWMGRGGPGARSGDFLSTLAGAALVTGGLGLALGYALGGRRR